MDNALRANLLDVREQYGRQIKALPEAYGDTGPWKGRSPRLARSANYIDWITSSNARLIALTAPAQASPMAAL